MSRSRTHAGPTILGYVADAANLVTLAGATCGVLGLVAASRQRILHAAALGVLAVLADCADGPVARRDRSRNDVDRAIGLNLDSLADIVSSGVLPAIVLVEVGDGRPAWTAAAVALVLSGILRLSFFNVHGATSGYVGLPVFYAPVLVAVLVLCTAGDVDAVRAVLLATTVGTAWLQVSTIRVPHLRGRVFTAFIVSSTAISIVLFWLGAAAPTWVDPALVGHAP